MRTDIPPELARSRWRPTAAERRRLRQNREKWAQVRNAERAYATQVRAVARNVGTMIAPYTEPVDINQLPQLVQMLNDYAWLLDPWARATAARMIEEVTRRDAGAWFKVSREIGTNLREMIEHAPIGGVIRQLLEDQVHLIQDIPREAGQRIQAHTRDFVMEGKRYDELVDDIQGIIPATVTRATLIARTETAKAQSAIVEARAKHVGAHQYIWRTVRDAAVRDAHRALEGSVQSWADPPVAEERGDRHHPGNFPNCRCYAEPILDPVVI